MFISKSAVLIALFGLILAALASAFVLHKALEEKKPRAVLKIKNKSAKAFPTPPADKNRPADYREWFVAPDGKPDAEGTLKAPLDLRTALGENPARAHVKAGDTVWLRGGVYQGVFTSTIRGTADLPIQVRGYENERAVLDKNSAERETGTLNVRGEYVWFRDFEVANSYPERKRLDPDGELNPWRGSGINVYAAQTRYINLVVRDGGHGFGLWNEDGGTEIYGCLIFNNGNNKKEHGVYAHNKTGTQAIRENIIFNGAGYGLHIYANSAKSSISGFDIEGNAVFNNGALTFDDQVADQILVGGVDGVPAERIALRENYIYNVPEAATAKNRGIRLGYENKANADVKIFDNYIVSKVPLKILWWNRVEARGNTIFSGGANVEIETPAGNPNYAYEFESNKYLNAKKSEALFIFNAKKEAFADWQQKSFDRRGRIEQANISVASQSAEVFVRPNKYDDRRANIIVYNWRGDARVAADLSKVLRRGDKYEIRDAQNYLGAPVLTGVFDGKPVLLPMNLSVTTKPVGGVERVPPHTDARFNVFVVRLTAK